MRRNRLPIPTVSSSGWATTTAIGSSIVSPERSFSISSIRPEYAARSCSGTGGKVPSRSTCSLSLALLFLRGEDFLNTDLINEMLAPNVSQVGSLLVVCQVCPNAFGHYHYERLVIHVEPVRTANQLVARVPHKWTVNIGSQVGFIIW